MAFSIVFILLSILFASALSFTLRPFSKFSVQSATSLNTVKIICTNDEPIENILRRFKRGVNQSGHLFDLRFKEHWENAHDKRKRKVERARMMNKIERTNDRFERQREGGNEYTS